MIAYSNSYNILNFWGMKFKKQSLRKPNCTPHFSVICASTKSRCVKRQYKMAVLIP